MGLRLRRPGATKGFFRAPFEVWGRSSAVGSVQRPPPQFVSEGGASYCSRQVQGPIFCALIGGSGVFWWFSFLTVFPVEVGIEKLALPSWQSQAEASTAYNTGLPAPVTSFLPPNLRAVTPFAEKRKWRASTSGSATRRR